MSDGDTVNVAWLAVGLLLVVSALVSRRLATRDWLRMAAAWAAIIGAGWIVVRLLGRFIDLLRFT